MSHGAASDRVFKALADAGRRRLLDALNATNGLTLGALGEHLEMTRQGVTQHLALLEAAGLVVTRRRGREKLHFLNPVPLQEIYERWIRRFERSRLRALSDLKARLEDAARAQGGSHG
jgi:DNA-binding transcriptional ArsR family regulator